MLTFHGLKQMNKLNHVFQVLFAILLGAFAVGKAGPNVEALLTAAGSAGAVLQIINKVIH